MSDRTSEFNALANALAGERSRSRSSRGRNFLPALSLTPPLLSFTPSAIKEATDAKSDLQKKNSKTAKEREIEDSKVPKNRTAFNEAAGEIANRRQRDMSRLTLSGTGSERGFSVKFCHSRISLSPSRRSTERCAQRSLALALSAVSRCCLSCVSLLPSRRSSELALGPAGLWNTQANFASATYSCQRTYLSTNDICQLGQHSRRFVDALGDLARRFVERCPVLRHLAVFHLTLLRSHAVLLLEVERRRLRIRRLLDG
jgi:hypothetical protein